MTSVKSGQMKTIMMIAMLVVAEGARVQQSVRFAQAGTERSASGAGYAEGRGAEMLENQASNTFDLHELFKDPEYQSQVETMAGKMDAFAAKMRSKPGLHAAAIDMARELSQLTEDPRAMASSMFPEQMEAMINNRYFQEHAQALAEEMQTVLEANVDFQDQLDAVKAAASADQTSAQVASKLMKEMEAPDFQQVSNRVSGALDSLMSDSNLQRDAFAAAQYIEQMKDSSDPTLPQKFSELVDGMFAEPRYQQKAAGVVTELFATPLKGEVEEAQKAVHMLSPATAFKVPGVTKAPVQSIGAQRQRAGLVTMQEAVQDSEPQENALTSAKGIRSMLPSIVKALPRQLRAKGAAMAEAKSGGVDFVLLAALAFWYLGNYYYNIANKVALNVAGGAAGFPMTCATLQLGVGVIYALFLWVAPDAREKPTITLKDYVGTLPLSAAFAGAHAATTISMGAGSVSFAQIVKAAEPAFAALIGTYFYGVKLSTAKWLSLIPVIGGVTLASLGELNFAVAALVSAAMANVFAAIKGNENKKLMDAPGVKERLGSVGNQFAITMINSFLMLIPVSLLLEGGRLGDFMTIWKTQPALLSNTLQAGAWFSIYNELATIVIKRAGAVAGSVANTAKRVIVIVGVALVMKEGLGPLKLIGSGIGIGGVLLYSVIDKLVADSKAKK